MTGRRRHSRLSSIAASELVQNVLETAWAYGPAAFLGSVLAHTGQSFEGEVSFGFHDSCPDEIAEGAVLSYLGDELALSAAALDRLVVDFAAARLAVTPEPALAALVAQLDARRDRRGGTSDG